MLMKSPPAVEGSNNTLLTETPRPGADTAPVVIILKKTQGAVWSEAGRTPLCPTLGWIASTYGAGQYELRLKQGNRILCMTKADCALGAGTVEQPARPSNGRAKLNESWIASGSARVPARTVLRGTVPG